MKTGTHVMKWIIALSLIAGCLSPASAAEVNPYLDPAWFSTKGTMSQLGTCKIMVLRTYFWRDWMPVVSHPGPDRGSPLRAKVTLSLDNSSGGANKLSFRTVVVDDKGQSYDVPFHVLPNYRVLPNAVAKSYRTYDEETRKAAVAQYNVTWNGELKPGEIREVELATAEGPYLPVGSAIHVRITWTDQKGDTAVVRTPDAPIQRTD